MKRINIFTAGLHRSSTGVSLNFSESKLSAAVSAYNPENHEAPIVIGHPGSNHPAYGWIKSIDFNEESGDLYAVPHQVNADFEEMVANGSFKKVSASWYLPDHPANPTPGTLHLRHVGFLGAQPPAIKGLKSVEFCEADDLIVEFEDSWEDGQNLSSMARVFKGLREFIIDKFSKEEADDIIPNWTIDDLNDASKRKFEKDQDENPTPNFNEESNVTELEKAQARIAALEKDNTALTANNGQLKTSVANFEEIETKRGKDALVGRVDKLVSDGFILPANRDQVLAFCENLDPKQTVEFGEGDDKKENTMVDNYLGQFSTKVVNFKEQSEDDGQNDQDLSAAQISNLAVQYQEEEADKGKSVSIQQAVAHVTSEKE